MRVLPMMLLVSVALGSAFAYTTPMETLSSEDVLSVFKRITEPYTQNRETLEQVTAPVFVGLKHKLESIESTSNTILTTANTLRAAIPQFRDISVQQLSQFPTRLANSVENLKMCWADDDHKEADRDVWPKEIPSGGVPPQTGSGFEETGTGRSAQTGRLTKEMQEGFLKLVNAPIFLDETVFGDFGREKHVTLEDAATAFKMIADSLHKDRQERLSQLTDTFFKLASSIQESNIILDQAMAAISTVSNSSMAIAYGVSRNVRRLQGQLGELDDVIRDLEC